MITGLSCQTTVIVEVDPRCETEKLPYWPLSP
jgi:hypothetical protein